MPPPAEPGFWDTVGDGHQQPGQFRGPGGTSPVQEINTASSSNYWSDYFRNQADGRIKKERRFYDPTSQDQARLAQQQVIQDLQRQAAGDPNSRAQQQLAQGYGAAQSQQSSLGSTMRGQSAGAAQRGIQAGQQGIQRGLAGDQQMLQAQEQQAAQSMLAQLLAQQQGQDITQAQGMAQSQLGQTGLNDAMRQFYLGAGASTDVAAQQLQGERGRANLGFDLEGRDINDRLNNQLINLTAGAAGTASSIYGKPPSSGGYRQVDGQNSIVPEWDK